MIDINKHKRQRAEASLKRNAARQKYNGKKADEFIIDGLRVEYAWNRLLEIAPILNLSFKDRNDSTIKIAIKAIKSKDCDADNRQLLSLKRLLPEDLRIRDEYIRVFKMTQQNLSKEKR